MNIKKILFSSLFVCTVLALIRRAFAKPASTKPVANSTSYDAIDAYIEGQMRRLKMPGVALAIVEGDKIVRLRGFGRSRPGGETPTPQTPFLIGSVTKSVTALAVMQLVESGKVSLDAPVKHYLPWFRVADPEASARITVRHLLNQTSGMSTLAGMICVDDSDDSPDATERQARAFSTLKLNRPVGASFQYCNLNYNLLGLVIEAASGQSYAEYVQEHIFTPLDMHHTYTSQVRAKQNGLAMGHRYWFGIPIAAHNIPIPPSSMPAGGLISTSEDMAHYLIAHLNGGRYGEAQIISSASIDELHRDVAEQRVLGASVTAYGMGWFVDKLDGTKLVSHGGNVPDFSAFVGLLPEKKKGVVLLVNADHGFPFILMEVGEGVAALLAGQQAPPIRLGFLPWMMRASALIPLLQIMGVVTTLRRLRCWRRDPALRPGCGHVWGEHILLPLIPNFSLAAILAYLRSSGLIRFMHLYMPDLSCIARISGGFAGIWAFVRTRLILQNLNCTSTPSTHLEDTNL
jgi:CubicO group peptidase (beta-lactamase class C family)